MKLNDDDIRDIYSTGDINQLIKVIRAHASSSYWNGYRDGYITGQGIGYQDGKYNGYCKAVQHIMKAD